MMDPLQATATDWLSCAVLRCALTVQRAWTTAAKMAVARRETWRAVDRTKEMSSCDGAMGRGWAARNVEMAWLRPGLSSLGHVRCMGYQYKRSNGMNG